MFTPKVANDESRWLVLFLVNGCDLTPLQRNLPMHASTSKRRSLGQFCNPPTGGDFSPLVHSENE
jgi:hypothetical protein